MGEEIIREAIRSLMWWIGDHWVIITLVLALLVFAIFKLLGG